MPARVSAIAAPGSLLKGNIPPRKKKLDMGRAPRQLDGEHLASIRLLPCLKCGTEPAGEAAHVRISAPGKPAAGMGAKPDDASTVPLCHQHHMEQHQGELRFWVDLGMNPLRIAAALYAATGRHDAMRLIVLEAISRS